MIRVNQAGWQGPLLLSEPISKNEAKMPLQRAKEKEIRLFSSRADEKSLLDEAASSRDGGCVGLRAVMVRAMRAFGGNALAVRVRNRSRCAQRESSRTLF